MFFSLIYSDLRASIGSRAAARVAGYKPKATPRDTENRKPMAAKGHETTVSQYPNVEIVQADPRPIATPIRPPRPASIADS
jgi:hypothetical protein